MVCLCKVAVPAEALPNRKASVGLHTSPPPDLSSWQLSTARKCTLQAKKKKKKRGQKSLLLYTLSAFASLISQITDVVLANEAHHPPLSTRGWAGEGGQRAGGGCGGDRGEPRAFLLPPQETGGRGGSGGSILRPLRAPSPRRDGAGRGRDKGRGWHGDRDGDIAAPPPAAHAQSAARRWRPEHGAAGAAAAQAALLLLARRPQPLRPPGPPERRGQAAGKAGGAACRESCPALPCPAVPCRAGEGLPGGGRLPLPQAAPRGPPFRDGAARPCGGSRSRAGESQRPPEGRREGREGGKGSRTAGAPPPRGCRAAAVVPWKGGKPPG